MIRLAGVPAVCSCSLHIPRGAPRQADSAITVLRPHYPARDNWPAPTRPKALPDTDKTASRNPPERCVASGDFDYGPATNAACRKLRSAYGRRPLRTKAIQVFLPLAFYIYHGEYRFITSVPTGRLRYHSATSALSRTRQLACADAATNATIAIIAVNPAPAPPAATLANGGSQRPRPCIALTGK